jgi:hypothetical protein
MDLIRLQQDAENSAQRAIIIGNSNDSSAWQLNLNGGRRQYGQWNESRLPGNQSCLTR